MTKIGYPSNVGNIEDKKDVRILNFTAALEKKPDRPMGLAPLYFAFYKSNGASPIGRSIHLRL
jgi:hypothetical protein